MLNEIIENLARGTRKKYLTKPKVEIEKPKTFPIMATIPWIDEYLDSGMEVGDFVKMMQGQKERKDKRRFDQEQSRLRKMIDNDKI